MITVVTECEDEERPFRPHFDTFNPKSFATLSHITLNIPLTVLPDNDPVDQTIADPYLSFCDSFLAKLCNLEVLDMNIQIEGYHRLLPAVLARSSGPTVRVMT
jgi:hypothetical protein